MDGIRLLSDLGGPQEDLRAGGLEQFFDASLGLVVRVGQLLDAHALKPSFPQDVPFFFQTDVFVDAVVY